MVFIQQVVSDSLRPHGLQHARSPCPSSSPGVCPSSYPLNWWCHPTISSATIILLLPSIYPSIKVFYSESSLCIRWPKYWSFSISPSNEYSGLVSIRLTGLIFLLSKWLSRIFSSTNHCLVMGRYLSNSMKLWAMTYVQGHSRWMGHKESSDQTWFTGGSYGKPLQYSCCENPVNCIKS